MKKIILLVAVMAMSLSCSKDESNELEPNMQNLQNTKWQFNKITKENGSVVNYQGLCPTKKDFFDIRLMSSGDLQYLEFYNNATCSYDCFSCYTTENDVPIDEDGNILYLFNENCFYEDGRISSLTKSKMKFVFDPPKIIDRFPSYGKVKAIELVKFVEE